VVDGTIPRIGKTEASAGETLPKPQYLIEARAVGKYFPGVQALKGVSVNVKPGEIHCWIGENGAGKSSLIKVFAGTYRNDTGETVVAGNPVSIESPSHSISLGLSFILQELTVVNVLSVADNILLGHEVSFVGNVRSGAATDRAIELLESIGFDSIDVKSLVGDLSVAEQQAVMIARALHLNANVIFFDETTASLGDEEAQRIFRVMRKIRDEGKGVVFVTHRLDEVVQVADRVTIFKDGEVVETGAIADFTVESMVSKMVGREISDMFPEKSRVPGRVVLEMEGVFTARVANISLSLRSGEVLGISGLVGSGRTEVLRAVFGLDKIESGVVKLDGLPARLNTPSRAIRAGIGFVPEDRRSQGIIGLRSVEENLTLSWAGRTEKAGWRKKGKHLTQSFIEKMQIKTPSAKQPIGLLSGGNQQKVIVSRWLATEPRLLLLDEPTRGIDVGAKAEMYRLIDGLASQGLGILLVSSELPELLGLSDRILVMKQGEIAGELPGSASEEDVLKLAMLQMGATS
jgi:ribose transport system ATP-binding protein